MAVVSASEFGTVQEVTSRTAVLLVPIRQRSRGLVQKTGDLYWWRRFESIRWLIVATE